MCRPLNKCRLGRSPRRPPITTPLVVPSERHINVSEHCVALYANKVNIFLYNYLLIFLRSSAVTRFFCHHVPHYCCPVHNLLSPRSVNTIMDRAVAAAKLTGVDTTRNANLRVNDYGTKTIAGKQTIYATRCVGEMHREARHA